MARGSDHTRASSLVYIPPLRPQRGLSTILEATQRQIAPVLRQILYEIGWNLNPCIWEMTEENVRFASRDCGHRGLPPLRPQRGRSTILHTVDFEGFIASKCGV